MPCPAGPLTWGQRSTFRTRRTAQPPRARCTRPRRCSPPSCPRIPLSTLICSPSLARCPFLALELVVSGTARDYCRRQGGLRDFGPWGDRELQDQRARCFPLLAGLPAKAPALLRPLGTLLSPLHLSPWDPRGCPRSYQAGSHALSPRELIPARQHPRPCCAPLGAPLQAAGLTQRCAPLRLPAHSAVQELRTALTLASGILSPSSPTPPHLKAFPTRPPPRPPPPPGRTPRPTPAGLRCPAIGGPRD